MSDYLDKQTLLAADDRPIIQVDVPEWGGHVYLVAMSGDARDRFDQTHVELAHDWGGLRASLVAAHLCDESGQLLGFTEAEVRALGRKSAAALDRLFGKCQQLSGITEADVEALEKNSPAAPNGRPGSSSASSTGSRSASSSSESARASSVS